MKEYKGYHAKLEVDTTSYKVRGRIEGINDFVDFEGNDCLTFCEEIGKEPDKVMNNTSGA